MCNHILLLFNIWVFICFITGYVQASKRDKKFFACAPNYSYAALCECLRRVFIYRQPTPMSTVLYNRKEGRQVGQVAKQQVASLETNDPILGFQATWIFLSHRLKTENPLILLIMVFMVIVFEYLIKGERSFLTTTNSCSFKHKTLRVPGWLSWLNSSGHDLMVHETEPCVGLYPDSVEPLWASLSPSLCPSPTHSLSLSPNKKINTKL